MKLLSKLILHGSSSLLPLWLLQVGIILQVLKLTVSPGATVEIQAVASLVIARSRVPLLLAHNARFTYFLTIFSLLVSLSY